MRAFPFWLVALLLAASLLPAKRLPIRTYTTVDGLARDHIRCIVQGSQGFLWFCTAEGLSRFDGYQFTNYRTEQGLPSNAIDDFIETRKGSFWITAGGRVCRFDPSGAPRFQCAPLTGEHSVPGASALYEDRQGGVWCGTTSGKDGLYHLDPHDTFFRHVDLPMSEAAVTDVLVDQAGTLWVGSWSALYRRTADGTTTRFTVADGLPNDYIMALLEDRQGHVWIGTRGGLAELENAAEVRQPPRWRAYTTVNGLPDDRIESLMQSSDGTLWVGTTKGLGQRTPVRSKNEREFQSYTVAHGLSAISIGALAEDRDGNLWVGTFGSGAMKVARNGFITYTEADGAGGVNGLTETRQGELCLISRSPNAIRIVGVNREKFEPVRPGWPAGIDYFGWGKRQIALQDHLGEWWIATGQGLARFPAVDRLQQLDGMRPKAVYTTRNGLAGDNIYSVFEDSRGDIWMGTIGLGSQDGLALWSRAKGTLHAFSREPGLPEKPVPVAFAEDRSGSVWIAMYHEGRLVRYRNGRFTVYVPGSRPLNTLFTDSAGRLWIGTSGGLIHVEDPTADPPQFVKYTTAHGLSSDFIGAITEDRWGRIYAATGRGIDRFEPLVSGPGQIKHYTTADGIVPGELSAAFRDRHGTLWFSTDLGVSQFTPAQDPPRAPPPVLVTGVSIGGVPRPVSDLGQTSVTGLRLHEEPLRVDYVGLGYSPGETLRYQYRLESADRDWSTPTDQRTVIYASLSPGKYRFLVRALASDGILSAEPATVVFTIVPPIWRTWWFLSLFAIAMALMIYGIHRYRLAQLLAVAHLRTRIATDLHDDIGASLSQIAILSEVAQRSTNAVESRSKAPLAEIAGISRELVDSLGDIVWAINPDHDHLSNLVYRMRRFASDVLGGQEISLQFRSNISDEDFPVGANVRRQVYLIFKEAVHNIARHSAATRVEVNLEAVDDGLVLGLRDNGTGFEPSAEHEGNGLASMRKRARSLGANFEVQSSPGQGTTLRLIVRLEARRTLAVLRGK